MERISVNFLPKEIAEEGKRKVKKTVIIRSSVVILIGMILVTVGLITAVVSQKAIVSSKKTELDQVKTKLNGLGQKESLILTLRNRIESITKVAAAESLPTQAYLMIIALTPEGINITNFAVDKGDLKISGDTANVDDLDILFNRLLDPKENDGKISRVVLDSLGLAAGQRIRFDLTLTIVPNAFSTAKK